MIHFSLNFQPLTIIRTTVFLNSLWGKTWRREPGRKGVGNSTGGGRGGGKRDSLGDRSRDHYKNILQYSLVFAIEKRQDFRKAKHKKSTKCGRIILRKEQKPGN